MQATEVDAVATSPCTPRERPADRCPGALALHAAEDGWLARVRLPGGLLTASQLGAVGDAAARIGSGLVDLTSRANLQLRGLAGDAAGELSSLLAAAGLLPSPAHDRARNVIASPVAGRHPRALVATDAIVAEIDRLLCGTPALAELPGRFLFAVDDGSGIALDQLADVALVGPDLRLALGGRWTALRGGARVAIAAAEAFLEERAYDASGAWRIADLPDGPARVAARIGTRIEAGGPAAAPAGVAPGQLVQRDGRVALTALAPLGRVDSKVLRGLAGIGCEMRISTRRTITLVDVEPGRADVVDATLSALGLVVHDRSGWLGLSACAGLGACPKAIADVRAAAARRAAVRGPGAPAEHWAACERRCGERAGQPVSIAAGAEGLTVRPAGGGELTVASVDQVLAVLR